MAGIRQGCGSHFATGGPFVQRPVLPPLCRNGLMRCSSTLFDDLIGEREQLV
jgi:hypothetical protein